MHVEVCGLVWSSCELATQINEMLFTSHMQLVGWETNSVRLY
jgi:hypothetical protein